jgi:hypothetical protein
MGMEEHTCLHNEPVGKWQKKKTLVLTLGNLPEKGGEKKNPGINPGQRHLKYTKAGSAIENAEAGSAIE